MVPPDMRDVGDCQEGYYGALCSACMPGFARSGSFGCIKCPDPAINILRISSLFLLLIIAICLLVKSTLSGVT